MEELKNTIQTLIERAGFQGARIEIDPENKKLSLFLDEGDEFKQLLPAFVNDLEKIIRLIAYKFNQPAVFLDVNNYRRERERLIVELAQAAARKAVTSKAPVDLPVLNAYERRLVHVELATRPDIKTESTGEGKDRHVVIRPISL